MFYILREDLTDDKDRREEIQGEDVRVGINHWTLFNRLDVKQPTRTIKHRCTNWMSSRVTSQVHRIFDERAKRIQGHTCPRRCFQRWGSPVHPSCRTLSFFIPLFIFHSSICSNLLFFVFKTHFWCSTTSFFCFRRVYLPISKTHLVTSAVTDFFVLRCVPWILHFLNRKATRQTANTRIVSVSLSSFVSSRFFFCRFDPSAFFRPWLFRRTRIQLYSLSLITFPAIHSFFCCVTNHVETEI